MTDSIYTTKMCGKFIAPEELKPKRATKGSAGYDFVAPKDVSIAPHDTVLFDTGVSIDMREGFVLNLYIRSSLGLKHGLTLTNSVAVIDSDYKDTIKAAIKNNSDNYYILRKGDRYMQGVFTKYFTADDDDTTEERSGGVGSTGK